MFHSKNIFKKVICLILSFMVISQPLQTWAKGSTANSSSTDTKSTQSSTSSSLQQAQKEKEDLESSLQDAQNLISNLKNSKDDLETKMQQLDAKLTNISVKMQTLETNLDKKGKDITSTQTQLQNAKQESDEQYQKMKLRMQYMYENTSGTSYFEVLFSAKSVSDFMNAADYIYEMSRYDRDMLKQYQDLQVSIQQKGNQLQQDYSDLKDMQAQLKTQQEAVSALKEEKKTQLASVGEEIDNATDSAQEFADELQAQNEVIDEIKAQQALIDAKKKADDAAKAAAKAAAEQASKTQSQSSETQETSESDSYAKGSFVWPSRASKTVSSDYGLRVSPTSGASTNHKGIDIAAPYGSDILAAAAGTVIYSGYSAASGNHVILDNGNGVCTVYMHASALSVSVGDTVTAGQVIAKVGSTGISTGNHLHFGVTLNGTYVSPWNYLSK